ncbi:hypothetical protein [Kribbella sp. NPDC049227]
MGQPAAALAFVDVLAPANAGTATAPAGSAAIASTANAVRIGLRMWMVV